MYKHFIFLGICAIISCSSFAQSSFTLQSYFESNEALDQAVEEALISLTPEERVAQMIIASLGKLGKPYETVKPLIQNKQIGGVIFLSGDPNDFKTQIDEINKLHDNWPMLMSMDAEPSLLNRRMPGTPEMKPTAELKSEEDISGAVDVIDSILNHVGFQQNFAPVVDLSANNEAIGNRNFGLTAEEVLPRATQFIHETQKDGIVATAKHFPGHGRVAGDTHKKLVYIDGELTEVDIYRPLIESGVLSIMVGHIAIENNTTYGTDGMPATLSPIIVNTLLRKEMGFDGIIITDAMNMGAVAAIPHSGLLAAKAGCDMILMPPDELGVLSDIMKEMESDPNFAQQIDTSVRRIVRLKLCLGMSFI
ncbi:MAG TPA: hypothetical protein DCX14_14740 [Flavobacteriales bacterium]|nr:hypothetical protein [Flavobacteriales bacterium]HAW21437.1 hypothetical protein [Flavobacteriales bacterium]